MSDIRRAALDDEKNEKQKAEKSGGNQRSRDVPAGANSNGHSSIYHQQVTAPIAEGASIQPQQSVSTPASAPALVLISRAPSRLLFDVVDVAALNLLGIGLPQRTMMAARRAGYGQIIFLETGDGAPPRARGLADWSDVAMALRLQTAPVVIAPATILGEIDWLEKLAAVRIEPTVWAGIPTRLIVLPAPTVADALATLQAEPAPHDIAAIEHRLEHRFGPAAPIPVDIDPMILVTAKDIRAAERRLLRSLVKSSDGFMARHFDRHISLQISRRLAPTRVEPTQVTMLSIAIGLCAAPFFLSSQWYWQTIGALLFLLHSIVDGCDGELARLKFQESRYGGILDFWGDNLVHIAIFAGMAAGWSLYAHATWPLWLGAAAIAGTLASASFVYGRHMRLRSGTGPLFTSVSGMPSGRLAQLLDAATRRDFVYLVPVLALFGQAKWLLLLAAVGAPVFFLALMFLAARERAQLRNAF
jgi:1L-myo-inositol 1-phosphate cytidylyltransferase / CDP-L-myo-inositol myo-inositolphosphotransferase